MDELFYIQGRQGKGTIYVWASGNGGNSYDSCASDGYVSSVYTIAVGSVTQDGKQSPFDESCPAKMAVTFSHNTATYFMSGGEGTGANNQVVRAPRKCAL